MTDTEQPARAVESAREFAERLSKDHGMCFYDDSHGVFITELGAAAIAERDLVIRAASLDEAVQMLFAAARNSVPGKIANEYSMAGARLRDIIAGYDAAHADAGGRE